MGKQRIEQHIGKDSEVFEEINSPYNAFKVSMDITASGNANTALTAKESGYSNVIESDMVLGVVPEFEYEEGFAVDDVVLNFDIEDSFTDNTNGKYAAVSDDFEGIKRFNVFKYFEEYDMLMPIETTYDLDNNKVITHVDELGTYCLVDMEKWFESLDIDPKKFDNSITPSSVTGGLGIGIPQRAISLVLPTETESKCLDVVLNVFTTRGTKEKAVDQLLETGRRLFDEYGENADLRIYIGDHKGKIVTPPDQNKNYAENMFDLEYMCQHIGFRAATDEPFLDNAASTLLNNLALRPEADKYYVSVQHDVVEFKNAKRRDLLIERALRDEITFCVVSNTKMTDTSPIAASTGGLFYNDNIFTYAGPISDYIIGFHGKKGDGEVYRTITSSGWKVIVLENPITSDYKTISENGVTDDDRLNYPDEDGDGLLDLEELKYYFGDVQAINWDDDGKLKLFTFEECKNILPAHSYIQNALEQYSGWDDSLMNEWRILPIKSDPTDADTDKDGLEDGIEVEAHTGIMNADTDGDGLKDGKEVLEWYDPLDKNPDGDSYDDRLEYFYDQDPYTYDLDLEDWIAAFVKGFIEGDFDTDDNIPTMLGQVTSGFLPIVADLRDIIANCTKKKWGNALLSGAGFLPIVGDGAKIAGTVKNFIIKNFDNAGVIVDGIRYVFKDTPDILAGIKKKCPEILGKIKESVQGLKKLTKNNYDNLKKAYGVIDVGFDDLLTDDVKKAKELAEKAANKIDDVADIAKKYGDDVAGYIKNLPDEKVKSVKRLLTKPSRNLDSLIKHSDDPSKVIDFLGDFGDDGADVIKGYGKKGFDAVNGCVDKQKAVNFINHATGKYGNDAVQFLERKGDTAIDAVMNITGKDNQKKCIQYIYDYEDDAIEIFTKHGDNAYNALNMCTDKKNAIKLIKDYGSDAAKAIEEFGDEAINTLVNTEAGNRADKLEELVQSICFIAGTKISTDNGSLPIEEIEVGMTVLSMDPLTGDVSAQKVADIFENQTDELVTIHVNGEQITSTPSHPFYLYNIGWTAASDLRAGDRLCKVNGEYAVVEWIEHQILESPVTVYNFEVADYHTYFVGESAVLVHNSCDYNYDYVKQFERYTGHPASGHVHHGLPKKHIKWFESKGINIDSGEYYFDLPEEMHTLKAGHGVHTNSSYAGKTWDAVWDEYRKNYPNATKEMIEVFLDDMAEEFKITEYRAVKAGG